MKTLIELLMKMGKTKEEIAEAKKEVNKQKELVKKVSMWVI